MSICCVQVGGYHPTECEKCGARYNPTSEVHICEEYRKHLAKREKRMKEIFEKIRKERIEKETI
jgi:hypothetical protein